MPPPFLTIDPRTSPITLSLFPSPKISPNSDTDSLGPRQNDDDLVSPLTPNDYSRLSGFPQLSNFDFAFDNRSSLSNLPSPSGPRRHSETTSVEQSVPPASVAQNSPSSSSTAAAAVPTAPPQLSITVPSNAVAGGVHRPAMATVEDAEAPPPYSRYAGASQPPAPGSAWGGAASRVAGVQNMPPTIPEATYTRGHQGFAPVAGAPINGSPRRQSGQRGLHALALVDQSQQQQGGQLSRQDTWREKITAGYWETEVEMETGSENKRLTRKGRRCVFATTGLVLLVIVIVAAVVGVVTSRKDGRDSGSGDASKESASVEPRFPELPEGTHVVKPQGVPEKLNSCVSQSSLWSCDLPSDSLFPTTTSPSDHTVLPEFRFTIQKGTESGADPRTRGVSIPDKTPNATDYAGVAEVDGVRLNPKSGEETKYYISLVTQDPRSTGQDLSRTADNTPSPVSSFASSEINPSSKPPRKRGLRLKRQGPPAPAENLLPETVKNQPLLFFDRGMGTEHYGFHMYYTKTIRATSESSASDPAGGLPSNKGPGTDVKWERTRFKVVIWTRKRSDGRVELIDSQGRRVQASADVEGLPYAVSIVQDRYGDRGPITYGPGLPKIIQEKAGRCLCEWTNWRTKS